MKHILQRCKSKLHKVKTSRKYRFQLRPTSFQNYCTTHAGLLFLKLPFTPYFSKASILSSALVKNFEPKPNFSSAPLSSSWLSEATLSYTVNFPEQRSVMGLSEQEGYWWCMCFRGDWLQEKRSIWLFLVPNSKLPERTKCLLGLKIVSTII